MSTSAKPWPELVGAWALVACRVRFSDGRPDRQPFGAAPSGRIIYEAGGRMSAVLMADSRRSASGEGGSLETSARASDAAKAAAYDSYLSYSGRWTREGDSVVHHVDLALVPEVVGSRQKRQVRLSGDSLTLSYRLTPPSGVTREFELLWRREP